MNYQKIFGDYVLTGIKNAFNNKTSWWLSKQYMIYAVYCFSTDGSEASTEAELARQTAAIDSYIRLFETQFEHKKGAES